MVSNAITNLESRKQVDTREMHDTQGEQLKIDLRHKLNATFCEKPVIWLGLWARTTMLNVVDLISEGLEEQL